MSVLIVIPARYGSTRLPGKMLLADTGKPLVQHTVENAQRVPDAEVLVATDDERIREAILAFGGNVVMTRPDHESGSDRIAEAVAGRRVETVVNVQGDEPEVSPQDIQTLITTHQAAMAGARPPFASTLVCSFADGADPDNPNAVKAALSQPDADGVRSALYFSRSRIPFPRSAGEAPYLHIGLYAYAAQSLQSFPTMARTPLERTESLEQLRILEHGHRIAAGVVPSAAPGIDTREDYDAFIARMR